MENPTVPLNQSQETNARFGSILETAVSAGEELNPPLESESIILSEEALAAIKDLLGFLKMTSLSDLDIESAVSEGDTLINGSSDSENILLQVLQGLSGNDERTLDEFFASIEELELDNAQEETALDAQSLLGANVMDQLTIVKQIATSIEEGWQQLPIEGTANLLKLVKLQGLLSENKDISQDEAVIQKQVKNLLEGINGKLEKWVSNIDQKTSSAASFSAIVDRGQKNTLEMVKNTFNQFISHDNDSVKQGLSLPLQLTRPGHLTLSNAKIAEGTESISSAFPSLDSEASTTQGTNIPVEPNRKQEKAALFFAKNVKAEMQAAINEITLPSTDSPEQGNNFSNMIPKAEQLVFTATKGGQSVSQEEFIKQFENILNKANFNASNGVNKLMIRLNPEHLGALRIELIQKDGLLTAKILANTAQAKDMLDSQLNALKQAFGGQQMNIERIEITQAFSAFNSEKFNQKESEEHSRKQQQNKKESGEESENEFSGSLADALINLEV